MCGLDGDDLGSVRWDSIQRLVQAGPWQRRPGFWLETFGDAIEGASWIMGCLVARDVRLWVSRA